MSPRNPAHQPPKEEAHGGLLVPVEETGVKVEAEPPPKEKDPMLIGYQFPYEKTKTPYDYLDDDKNPGFRVGENFRKAQGVIKTNLMYGIDGVTLPPLAVWKKGLWFNELTIEQEKLVPGISKEEQYNTWIVQGEGTPGNYMLRVYILPDSIAAKANPNHPMMWSKKLKEGEKKNQGGYKGQTSIYSNFHQPHPTPAPKPVPPPVKKVPSLPAGILFQCVGCGHWYTETKLAPHNTHCCPVLNDGKRSHWLIKCECCDLFDEMASAKEGFPIVPEEKEVKPESEQNGKDAVATA